MPVHVPVAPAVSPRQTPKYQQDIQAPHPALHAAKYFASPLCRSAKKCPRKFVHLGRALMRAPNPATAKTSWRCTPMGTLGVAVEYSNAESVDMRAAKQK